MNIVLIGYRGTGKSSVAHHLSLLSGWQRVSLDEAIVKDCGMPIPRIVEENGWDFFRNVEERIVEQTARGDRLIIDTGGGVILRPANITCLRKDGTLIWLRASVPVIAARIGSGTDRPALTDGKTVTEEIEEVLVHRTPLYAAAADHIIDTDHLAPEAAARCIIDAIKVFDK